MASDHVAVAEYVDFDMLDATDEDEDPFPIVTSGDVHTAQVATLRVATDPLVLRVTLMLVNLPASMEVRRHEGSSEVAFAWSTGAKIACADDAATDALTDLGLDLWVSWHEVSRSTEVCAMALRRATWEGLA